jgi:hypothetical protein
VEMMEELFWECVKIHANKEGISINEAYKRILETDRKFNRRVL